MSDSRDDQILRSVRLYRDALRQTRQLFLESGEAAEHDYAWLGSEPEAADATPPPRLSQQLDDLHQGFVMKVFATVCPDARAPTLAQRQLGRVLLEHLWGETVMGRGLPEAVQWLIDTAEGLSWFELTRPFVELPSLRDRWAEVETMAVRMAKLIATVDGDDSPQDRQRIAELIEELQQTTSAGPPRTPRSPASNKMTPPPSPAPADSERPVRSPSQAATADHQTDLDNAREAIRWLRNEADRLRRSRPGPNTSSPAMVSPNLNTPAATPADASKAREAPTAGDHPSAVSTHGPQGTPREPTQGRDALAEEKNPEQRLAEARQKLDRLIGLEGIKNQIESLTNFLAMDRHRTQLGLPTTRPSLHMAFVGNPGTGKTTVARIVAEIYGALGVLSSGHLVETDRSGLVAEFAGQTGPKTNAKIDEALDGVLFIDEAYSLVDESGQDAYGREAVQTLLKRMEDQRDRLVVILAGYPNEMNRMIRSNPGLSSRVGTILHFEDYDPESLCRIFALIAGKAAYELPPATRRRLLRGFAHLFFHRDRHFGNGRTCRNTFERSVRRLANRVAEANAITRELLITLEPHDIEIPGLSDSMLDQLIEPPGVIRVLCTACDQPQVIDDRKLGQDLDCEACQEPFRVTWGTPISHPEPRPEGSQKVAGVTETHPRAF